MICASLFSSPDTTSDSGFTHASCKVSSTTRISDTQASIKIQLLFEETMNITNHIFLGITEILTGLGSHYSQALRKCKQEEDSFETFIFLLRLSASHLFICDFACFASFVFPAATKKNLKNTSENQKTLRQNSRLSCATVRTTRTYELTRL